MQCDCVTSCVLVDTQLMNGGWTKYLKYLLVHSLALLGALLVYNGLSLGAYLHARGIPQACVWCARVRVHVHAGA